MNHSQRNLKKLIRAKEDSIADEELFLSAAYQKYQTSLARAVTGRYRYGLQVLLDWDISEQAGVAYTDNYKVHLNAANPITQSFPTRFLRSQSLTGLTGHEVGHLLYSDFTAHAVHLRSLENGSFYPKEPELSLPAYQTALEEIKEVLTGYIQGMLEALTMLTTVEDGKRFKIKLEQFRQNLLLSGDYDATGNYKQAVKKTAV